MWVIFEFPIIAIFLFIALLIIGPWAVLQLCSSILPAVAVIFHIISSYSIHKDDGMLGPAHILSTTFECFTLGIFYARYPYPLEKLREGVIDGTISFIISVFIPILGFFLGVIIFKMISLVLYKSNKAWWIRWSPVFVSLIAFILTGKLTGFF